MNGNHLTKMTSGSWSCTPDVAVTCHLGRFITLLLETDPTTRRSHTHGETPTCKKTYLSMAITWLSLGVLSMHFASFERQKADVGYRSTQSALTKRIFRTVGARSSSCAISSVIRPGTLSILEARITAPKQGLRSSKTSCLK